MKFKANRIIYKIRGISLKWKLLIPFLSLAFIGTVTLVYIGLTSQYRLIENQERKEIQRAYQLFLWEIENTKRQMLSLSTLIAEDDTVVKLLEQRDRLQLRDKMRSLFLSLKERFGVSLIHFHVPPGRSFLRLHAPESHGEMLAYRKSIIESLRTRKPVTTLEWGLTGLAIRAVSPVVSNGHLIGSVEVGYPFGGAFLFGLKKTWGPDFTVYEKRGESTYVQLASTSERGGLFLQLKTRIVPGGTPKVLIAPKGFSNTSLLIGPILGYYGEIVGVVEIDIDRSDIKKSHQRTKEMMAFAGLAGIAMSFLLTWLIASIFVRPIREIVKEAEEIAEGTRESHLGERPEDEIGHLSKSLNKMLEVLQTRQKQIEEYARTLEQRVRERTADLVASEEKYRTLVDNLPLVVYRLQEDGTTEFINPYFTEKLGYTPEEVVGNKNFWRMVICGGREWKSSIIETCWGRTKELRTERKVRSKEGQLYIFIDQAMPMKDEKGNIKWIDGIMLDITELKRLQERALRSEEIRILGEMSARFAHEFRNPLATAGGFARRLANKLPEGGEYRKFAQIIVEEVSRLENILRIMLSSIEPVELAIGKVDMGKLLELCIHDLENDLRKRAVKLNLQIPQQLPIAQADEDLLLKALESVLGHVVAMSAPGESITLKAGKSDDSFTIDIYYRAPCLDEEDIDQFFLPRQVEAVKETAVALPLAKVIIHRHGGIIEVSKDRKGDLVNIRIEIPIK